MIEAKTVTSTIADGKVTLRIERRTLPSPAAGEVIVAMEAASFNPSDQFMLLGTARLDAPMESGSPADDSLSFELAGDWGQMFRARLGEALSLGNEGAGRVVAAGAGAEGLVGRNVAVFGTGLYATHYLALAKDCVPLPDDVSTLEASALFVNPLTALVMLEASKAGGHRGIVQTAAASTLGQMVLRVCREDAIPLVNIVRGEEQSRLLESLGAKYVVNSAMPDFRETLSNALEQTRATVAFDAIGGGDLADAILNAMEISESARETGYRPYGSQTLKQLYVYGGLDPRPTILSRTYGVRWSIGGFFLLDQLAKLGEAKRAELIGRALSGVKTTFATHFAGTFSLNDMLDPATLIAATRRATGEKYALLFT